ncbi:transmembrane protein 107-like isoform X2 [Salvelinus fontinalis]|uniref:transmembrane protein 107-like isoform X2 n=1 Tax=Salvelinus fontinalis TaxID=8038 RepID=UPI0024865E83|nr:transmembrane protein 107-like isoform X2 [Salvelinus fontinalis]
MVNKSSNVASFWLQILTNKLNNVVCPVLGTLDSQVSTIKYPYRHIFAGAMSAVSSLVPARFLTLTAHLVIVITIFWSRVCSRVLSTVKENNVEACLPLDFTQDQYDKEDTKLVVALSVTMGLFAIELAGFFSGVSMFNCTQGLLSTAAHASASLALLFFLFEQWACEIYWWILAFCSVLPAFVEILLFIAVFGLKKKPL